MEEDAHAATTTQLSPTSEMHRIFARFLCAFISATLLGGVSILSERWGEWADKAGDTIIKVTGVWKIK